MNSAVTCSRSKFAQLKRSHLGFYTVAVAIWQDGASIKELGGMSFYSGAEEEPMRLATLVTATALGLAGFATAYLYHDKSDPPHRYGSWQELSAAQPSCKSMTNHKE